MNTDQLPQHAVPPHPLHKSTSPDSTISASAQRGQPTTPSPLLSIVIAPGSSASNSDADFHIDARFDSSNDSEEDPDSFAFADGTVVRHSVDHQDDKENEDSSDFDDSEYFPPNFPLEHNDSYETLPVLSEPEIATVHTANVAVNFGAQNLGADYNLPAYIVQRLSQNPGQKHQLVEIPQSPTFSQFRTSQINNPLVINMASPTSPTTPAPASPRRPHPDSNRILREEISRFNNGDITPGIDDTLFVRTALNNITRTDGIPMTLALPVTPATEVATAISRQMEHGVGPTRQTASKKNPDASFAPDDEKFMSVARGQPQLDRTLPGLSQHVEKHEIPPVPTSGRPKTGRFNNSNWVPVSDDIVRLVDPQRVKYPAQNFVPAILGLPSFLALGALTSAMTAVLMCCAIHSTKNDGLSDYTGSINSHKYFVFRILPAFISAIILLYTQSIISATFRLLPFARMASANPAPRTGAIFQDLYPQCFAWPELVGPLPVKYAQFTAWLLNFAMPLHAAGFVVKYYGGAWRWTVCQGVTWVLVVIYLFLLSGLGVLCHYWFGRTTGLLWDIRSIADVIPMLNLSNINRSYTGTQFIQSRRDLMAHLENNMVDRLGYWSHDSVDIESPSTVLWHAIGISYFQVGEVANYEKRRIKGSGSIGGAAWNEVAKAPGTGGSTGGSTGGLSSDATVRGDASDVEALASLFTYRPWCLRVIPGISFLAGGLALYIAFLVVTFLPGTQLSDGFSPDLRIAPDAAGFSPASFVFSFIPALIGQILLLLFQSYELQLRIMTPWAALAAPEGAKARYGLLADYAACLPGQTVMHAFVNGEYRLAVVSFLATLFVFLPGLAGGLLMALSRGAQVRMYASLGVLYTLVALVTLYVVGLAVMVPGRRRLGLPHAVGCLAEVISFVAGWEAAGDVAFAIVKGKEDLVERLGGGESEWCLGGVEGGVGVRRVRRVKV